MINSLIEILYKEQNALIELLKLLDRQHKSLIDKDVFALEGIVDEIRMANKVVAESEVERRKLIGNKSMKDLVLKSDNKELDILYRNIQKILHSITVQKDTNELLIKQGLSYTNRLLTIINPRREVKTYNSYGRV
jgi:flagellar biosynthesis/type III secretory pathway chaperone